MNNYQNQNQNQNRFQKNRFQDAEESKYKTEVVEIKRVSKKTKGGNQIGFTALVVVGDKEGSIGIAHSKAKDVASAIRKAERRARRVVKEIDYDKELKSLKYPVEVKYKSTKIILKPAKEGTGLIAGGPVRVIAESVGLENLVAKIIGSRNKSTVVRGTFNALMKYKIKKTND